MEKRTEGAWLIHHTKKLLDITDTQDFEDIELSEAYHIRIKWYLYISEGRIARPLNEQEATSILFRAATWRVCA